MLQMFGMLVYILLNLYNNERRMIHISYFFCIFAVCKFDL